MLQKNSKNTINKSKKKRCPVRGTGLNISKRLKQGKVRCSRIYGKQKMIRAFISILDIQFYDMFFFNT